MVAFMEILNFIDGVFTQPTSTEFFVQERPFADRSDVKVANSSQLDFVKALQGSHIAFNEWKESSIADRSALLEKISSYLAVNKNKFAELEALDQGLNFDFSVKANINIALAQLNQFKHELESPRAADEIANPVGVVGVILSWNLSTRLFVEKVIPALLAGNSVIVKVSSSAPATAQLWGELFQSVGLGKGLVQILHSQDANFKKLMITHPGIKALSFTGSLESSAEVIKSVAQVSGQQFKKLQINSGTKNTAAILNDVSEADMELILESFLQGQGQLAWNSSRLFILEKNEKIWTDFVAHKLQDLKPSSGVHDKSMWTPLVRNKYIENFRSLENQAVSDQAKIITVAQKPSGAQFVEPFFTKDMSNCSTLQQDQVMGPAFVISVVKYPFDIPKYSNVSYFGHSANVWTELGKNQKTIKQLDVGHVSLNQWSIFYEGPISGVKQSAFGVTDRQIFGAFFSNVKKISSLSY